MTWSGLIFSATLAVAPAQMPSSQPVVFAPQIATQRVIVAANLEKSSKNSAFDQHNFDNNLSIDSMATEPVAYEYNSDNSCRKTMDYQNRFYHEMGSLAISNTTPFNEISLYGRPLNETYFTHILNHFFKSWRLLSSGHRFAVNLKPVDLSCCSSVLLSIIGWHSLLNDAIYTYSQSHIANNRINTLIRYANSVQYRPSLHNNLMRPVVGNELAVGYYAKFNSAIYIYANRLDSVTLTNFMEIGLSERNNNVERECRG